MRFIHSKLIGVVLSIAIATTALIAVPNSGLAKGGDTVTAGEVSTALHQTSGPVAAPARYATDGDSVAQTARINLPRDARKGIDLKGPAAKKVTVKLPGAKRAGKGTKTPDGAVAYPGRDGSANAVVPTTDGVQFLTIIESRNAPAKYSYRFDLPAGGKIEVATKGSNAVVFDGHNKAIAIIAAPWARDANGTPVASYFTTNGKTLTQHVAHKAQGVAYPVVADPYFRWYSNGVVITLSRSDMLRLAYRGTRYLISLLEVPGVGWVTIVGVLGMAAYAWWGYTTHNCAWFWLPYRVYGASAGFYRC